MPVVLIEAIGNCYLVNIFVSLDFYATVFRAKAPLKVACYPLPRIACAVYLNPCLPTHPMDILAARPVQRGLYVQS